MRYFSKPPFQRVFRNSFWKNIDSLAKTRISIFLDCGAIIPWKNILAEKHQQTRAFSNSTVTPLKLTFSMKCSNPCFFTLSSTGISICSEFRNTLCKGGPRAEILSRPFRALENVADADPGRCPGLELNRAFGAKSIALHRADHRPGMRAD